jgi:hypothetical protein
MPEFAVIVRMRVDYLIARILRAINVRIIFFLNESEHAAATLLGSQVGDLLL